MKRRQYHPRQYSDAEKSAALALLQANGCHLTRTSEQTGIPINTLESWKQGRVHPDVLKSVEERKVEMANFMTKVVWSGLRRLPKKFAGASAKDIAISIGILCEKMLLLTGNATTIIAKEKMTDEQLFSKLQKLAQAIKDRAAQLPASALNKQPPESTGTTGNGNSQRGSADE